MGHHNSPRLGHWLVFFGLLLVALPANALRVMTYNLLRYPSAIGDSREDDFRVVFAEIVPDLVIVQEITSTSGATEFLNDVLNTLEPGEWALAPFVNGPDTDNACYYRISDLDDWATSNRRRSTSDAGPARESRTAA